MNTTTPIGNENTLKILSKIVKSKNIAQSYIFSGVEGVGKKLFALYFAKMLNCEKQNTYPCNECSQCLKIDKKLHPDILLLSTERKQISIEMIKDILSFAITKSFEGRYKVIIIDEAEKMNKFAANALLKTIEEPAPNTIIILLTSNVKKLLPTIISRCLRINFSPLKDEELKKILIDKGFTIDKVEEVVYISEGSAKKAIEMLDDEIFMKIKHIRQFIERLDNKTFHEIAVFSEKVAKSNMEEFLFAILTSKYISELNSFSSKNIFKTLNEYQKTVIFCKNLRYNVSKSFLIEALFLALQK